MADRTPSPDGTRVVLLKPGDILAIGNLGSMSEDAGTLFARVKEELGLSQVWAFEGDIDLAAIPIAPVIAAPLAELFRAVADQYGQSSEYPRQFEQRMLLTVADAILTNEEATHAGG